MISKTRFSFFFKLKNVVSVTKLINPSPLLLDSANKIYLLMNLFSWAMKEKREEEEENPIIGTQHLLEFDSSKKAPWSIRRINIKLVQKKSQEKLRRRKMKVVSGFDGIRRSSKSGDVNVLPFLCLHKLWIFHQHVSLSPPNCYPPLAVAFHHSPNGFCSSQKSKKKRTKWNLHVKKENKIEFKREFS